MQEIKMETKLKILTPEKDFLAAIHLVPENKTGQLVIMTHGFGSGKNNKTNRLLGPALANVGISSLRFDFSGHYDSSGDAGNLTIGRGSEELNCVFDFAMNELGYELANIGFFGSSFGASAILWDSSRYTRETRVGLKAPIVDYPKVRLKQLSAEGVEKWKKTGFAEIESSQGPILSRYEFFAEAKRKNLVREMSDFVGQMKIIHGDKDDNAPLEDSIELVNSLRDHASILVVSGAGHGFSGEGQLSELVEHMVEFFAE